MVNANIGSFVQKKKKNMRSSAYKQCYKKATNKTVANGNKKLLEVAQSQMQKLHVHQVEQVVDKLNITI